MVCDFNEDYREFIIQYPFDFLSQYFEEGVGCVEKIGSSWAIYSGPAVGEVSTASKGYYSIPKLYKPMDTGNLEKSGIGRVHRQNNLALTGDGVIVGMVDTGIDIFNSAFRDSAGFTRIGTLWDQTMENGEFYEEEINEYLQTGSSRNAPGRDENGHGTFAMGIACASRTEDYTGVAFYSEIAVVKLRRAKDYLRSYYFEKEEWVYSETDIMLGVKYLVDYARRRKKPLVIMVGLGCELGPHDGKTPLEEYLDEVARGLQTVVCACGGNMALAGLHYEGVATGTEYETVELQVDEGQEGIIAEVWSETANIFSVGLVSPTGEVVDEIPPRLNMSSVVQFIFANTRVTVDYKLIEVLSGKEVIILRFQNPIVGIWKLRIYRGKAGDRFDIWLGSAVKGNTRLVQPSPYVTITSPGNAQKVITTGGYNHIDDSLYIDSGRGYTSEGQVKPDIVAPSVEVIGIGLYGLTQRSGTSIGNAHTVGVCALLLEWGIVRGNIPLMNTDYVKSLLIRGARRINNITYPSMEWGWGMLEAYRIFELLAGNLTS